jgi:hypothetical protein
MPRPRAVRKGLVVRGSRQHDDVRFGQRPVGIGPETAQESQSVHRRHPHVAQHRAGSVAGAEQCHRAGSVRRVTDIREADSSQYPPEGATDEGVVLDQPGQRNQNVYILAGWRRL